MDKRKILHNEKPKELHSSRVVGIVKTRSFKQLQENK
jgi:hypothetical protein